MSDTHELSGFIDRELTELLDRFRERRKKLQTALDAAAELDRVIPKIERLVGATLTAKPSRPAAGNTGAPTQKERIVALLRAEGELRPPAIADRTGIQLSSVHPVLRALRDENAVEKHEDGTWSVPPLEAVA